MARPRVQLQRSRQRGTTLPIGGGHDDLPAEEVMAHRLLQDLAPIEREQLLEEQHWRRREGRPPLRLR
jgi:hypothetical protein